MLKYQLEQGRHIFRDGNPFATIAASGRANAPEVESFARQIIAYMNEQELFKPHELSQQIPETPISGFIAQLVGAAIGSRGDYRVFRQTVAEIIDQMDPYTLACLTPAIELVRLPQIKSVATIIAQVEELQP